MTLRAESPIIVLCREETRRLCQNCVKPLRLLQCKLLDYSQIILFSLIKLFFSGTSICLLITNSHNWAHCSKRMATKFGFNSNMLGMLNKDLTWFMVSPFWIHQNEASERKSLLAGCLRSSVMLQQGLVGNNTVYVTNRTSVCIVLMWFYNQMCFWYCGFSWSNLH